MGDNFHSLVVTLSETDNSNFGGGDDDDDGGRNNDDDKSSRLHERQLTQTGGKSVDTRQWQSRFVGAKS